MDVCLKCGMRNDDWFLCRKDDCAAKAFVSLEAEAASLREQVEMLTKERDEHRNMRTNLFFDLATAVERVRIAEARNAVMEKALRVIRENIFTDCNTIMMLAAIDAALTPTKETNHV